MASGYAPVFAIFAGLVAIGLGAELVWRRLIDRADGQLVRFGSIGIFSTVTTAIFFAVDWPPLARLALLAYISAFIVIRLVVALMSLIDIPRRQRSRLSIIAVVLAISIATSAIAGPLGVDPNVAEAVSICFSLVVLVLSLETVWSTWEVSPSWRAAGTAVGVMLWVAWCLDMKGVFWLASMGLPCHGS
ncbi:hypothetical protein ASC97_24055 [Rhizobium sp. Root1203]|nr:hypothetical protein ASC97_24055 [Rhizobium sp. Root1203]